jgi:hypothetical protein
VGGKTKGKVTNAKMGARHRDLVCDSHQAKGVATPNNKTVVTLANCTVKTTALHADAASENHPLIMGGPSDSPHGE